MSTSSDYFAAASQLRQAASSMFQEAEAFYRLRSSIVTAVKDLGDISVENDWTEAYKSIINLSDQFVASAGAAEQKGEELRIKEEEERRSREEEEERSHQEEHK